MYDEYMDDQKFYRKPPIDLQVTELSQFTVVISQFTTYLLLKENTILNGYKKLDNFTSDVFKTVCRIFSCRENQTPTPFQEQLNEFLKIANPNLYKIVHLSIPSSFIEATFNVNLRNHLSLNLVSRLINQFNYILEEMDFSKNEKDTATIIKKTMKMINQNIPRLSTGETLDWNSFLDTFVLQIDLTDHAVQIDFTKEIDTLLKLYNISASLCETYFDANLLVILFNFTKNCFKKEFNLIPSPAFTSSFFRVDKTYYKAMLFHHFNTFGEPEYNFYDFEPKKKKKFTKKHLEEESFVDKVHFLNAIKKIKRDKKKKRECIRKKKKIHLERKRIMEELYQEFLEDEEMKENIKEEKKDLKETKLKEKKMFYKTLSKIELKDVKFEEKEKRRIEKEKIEKRKERKEGKQKENKRRE